MDDEYEYRVRIRAYELWVDHGRPNDSFWEQAETEVKIALEKNGNGFDAAADENQF